MKSLRTRDWFGIWPLAVMLCGVATYAAAQELETSATTPEAPAVFCLKTEFFPGGYDETCRPDRLARELGRQTVLIAARESLALATRDESLEEPFPEELVKARQVMNAAPRAHRDGKFDLTLWAGTSTILGSRPGTGNPAVAPKPWTHETTFAATPYDNYLSMLAKLEPLSRNELPEALGKFGYSGAPHSANPNNKPPESIEPLLLDMNFVSAYTAVRAAHTAIAKDGESPEWLGVLVRGYTNLSLMTFQQWTSMNEVFAARALLYAERLVNSRPDEPVAHAHRAYARAIIGLHAAALAELKEIEALREKESAGGELPAWFDFLGPYCRFEREALEKLVGDRRSMTQLGQRLVFQLVRTYEDRRWIIDASQPALEACPEDFSIGAMLAADAAMPVNYAGANSVATALANLLPKRIASLPIVPKAARDAAGGDFSAVPNAADDPEPNDRFSAVPTNIARALVAASEGPSADGEPSWAVLGKLIEEEQFTEVANCFGVIGDATESLINGGVADVLPFVGSHRYANYIKSYTVRGYTNDPRVFDILGDLRFVEERGPMQWMLRRSWNLQPNQNRSGRGRIASWHAVIDSSLTLPELLSAADQLDYYWWWNDMPPERKAQFADEVAIVSPHSPQALRWKIWVTPQPTIEQMVEWEEKAGQDPVGFRQLGEKYSDKNQYDDAVRCFSRSIDLSPTYNSFVGLANAYRSSGQSELWVPMLERMLDVPNLNSEHIAILNLIANDFAMKRQWKEAEPYAVRAAETGSSSSMQLAADVYEAEGNWAGSEDWTRKLATFDPIFHALDWFEWCCRTGRGDLEAARKHAEQFLSPEWIRTNEYREATAATYYQLLDKPRDALPYIQTYIEQTAHQSAVEQIYNRTRLAELAREVEDQQLLEKTLTEIRGYLEKDDEAIRKIDPKFPAPAAFVCDLLAGKHFERDQLAEMLTQLDQLTADHRRNYAYLIGRALELHGDAESADSYYRLIIAEPPFDKHCRNLAGHRLAARHGTSRP